MRHVHTNFLWIQNRAADTTIKFEKEKGTENPADLFTKNVPRELLERFCRTLKVDLGSDVNEEGFKLAALEQISEDVTKCVAKASMVLEPWIRMDLQSQCLRGTRPGEPATKSVAQRRMAVVFMNCGGGGASAAARTVLHEAGEDVIDARFVLEARHAPPPRLVRP